MINKLVYVLSFPFFRCIMVYLSVYVCVSVCLSASVYLCLCLSTCQIMAWLCYRLAVVRISRKALHWKTLWQLQWIKNILKFNIKSPSLVLFIVFHDSHPIFLYCLLWQSSYFLLSPKTIVLFFVVSNDNRPIFRCLLWKPSYFLCCFLLQWPNFCFLW